MQIFLLPEEVFEPIPKEEKQLQTGTIVQKVEIPKDEGMFMYIKDWPYPVKGIPDPRIFQSINFVKRLIIFPIQILKQKPFRYILPLLVFMPKNSLLMILKLWADFANRALNGYYLKRERFCKPVRVLYDIFTEMTTDQELIKLGKSICMLAEFDNVYRYRLQDLVGEIKIDNLIANPRKEVLRIVDIAIRREKDITEFQTNKIRAIKPVLSVLLMRGFVKEFVKRFALELRPRIQDMYLDKGDKWFCANWSNYEFKDIPVKERIELWRKQS